MRHTETLDHVSCFPDTCSSPAAVLLIECFALSNHHEILNRLTKQYWWLCSHSNKINLVGNIGLVSPLGYLQNVGHAHLNNVCTSVSQGHKLFPPPQSSKKHQTLMTIVISVVYSADVSWTGAPTVSTCGSETEEVPSSAEACSSCSEGVYIRNMLHKNA